MTTITEAAYAQMQKDAKRFADSLNVSDFAKAISENAYMAGEVFIASKILNADLKESSVKEIDWEQRRYEIAKDMLSVMYIDEGQESRKGNHNIDFEYKDMNSCTSEAVRWADVLIKELKKTSK